MGNRQQKVPVSLGILGVIIGLLAIGCAIFQDDLRAATAKEQSFSEALKDAGKKLIADNLSGESDHAEKERRDRITLIYTGLGFISIILGVISWIRKDHVRISGAAVSLGLVAVAWQYVLIAIAVAVVIFLIANLG